MQIVKANKNVKKIRVALYGDSGAGKTHAALAMAHALGLRVLVIDSEDGASHIFSELYKFDVLQISDTKLSSYTEAIQHAQKHQKEYDVVVVDSLTHAWQSALTEVSKVNNTQLGWGRVGPQWDAIIHGLKSLSTHCIVTMRAKSRQIDGKWSNTWDARENTDYEFDIILEMLGLRVESGKTVAKARVAKNRFNTGNERLNVGKEINASPSLMKFIVDWQAAQPVEPTPATEQTPAAVETAQATE